LKLQQLEFSIDSRERLSTIKSVEGLIENVLILCELLWVVMQLDLERLKNRVDNSEEVSVQAQECAKRIVSGSEVR
jgi:hypothetical protein